MILSEQKKEEFLTSTFHPYFKIEVSLEETENTNPFVNFVLPISTIDEEYAITSDMKSYFNDNFTNVIFTSSDDKYIYKYECYKNIYFIRMQPFDSIIKMHILPKKYDGSDTDINSPLIFKDSEEEITSENFFYVPDCYYRKDDIDSNINLYYEDTPQDNPYGLYIFNIKNKAKNFENLQINAGYSYNNTNPTYDELNPTAMNLNHYIGILDHSDENGNTISPNEYTEFNVSLMDANYNNICDYSNVSKQQEFILGEITWPTETTPYTDGEEDHIIGFNNPHDIDTIYHKTIKYFNDSIYIEENNKFLIQLWTEPRETIQEEL